MLPAFGLGGAVRIVIIVLAIGLVPVLIFAWVFELTPEGWKRESEVDRSRSVTPQSGRKSVRTADMTTYTAPVLDTATASTRVDRLPAGTAAPGKSIAVPPVPKDVSTFPAESSLTTKGRASGSAP